MTKIIIKIGQTGLGTDIVNIQLADYFGIASKIDDQTVSVDTEKNFDEALDIIKNSVFFDPTFNVNADEETNTITVERTL